jgi:hypothetical protein
MKKESLPTIKWMSSGLGDGFDESLQVMEDGNGIFNKSDIG